MAKVQRPFYSGDAWGKWANSVIFHRGGVVRKWFTPRNPNTPAQQAQRDYFREHLTMGITKEQADAWYAAINHNHDELYAAMEHAHDHGALTGLGDDDHPHYLNQTRGDARYALTGHTHAAPVWYLPFGVHQYHNPITTATAATYSCTVGFTITFVSWDISVYVTGTHNASNYWILELRRLSDAAVISTLNTNGMSVGAWTLKSTTSFDIASIGTSGLAVYLYCRKQGTPTELDICVPLVGVTGAR